MTRALRAPIALADYLASEDTSSVRREYVAGQVYAMTGGTLRHNRIAGNIFARLHRALDGSPCQVFINDVKLHVEAVDCVYYPDVLVHCGGGPAGAQKVLTGAALVVEVLSESTAETDRREKRMAYQRLPGLRAYWIVSQDLPAVEVYEPDALGRWTARLCGPGDVLPAAGLAIEPLAVSAVYAGTDLA